MIPEHSGKIVAERFEIGRLAGSGGMGVVYQSRDRETGRAVALKVLLERDQGPAERFAQEVELLSKLDHPNIVGYVDHGVTSDGDPFLVMPWLQGVDLQERLLDGPLSIEETITLARGVAAALEYLHGQGLVHRDLKPSNLFLLNGNVENVQIIDLGVARPCITSRARTQSGVMVGTAGFIAPEQAREDGTIAPAVDIFALGCVLFECLTGRPLFVGSHLLSVLAKILLEDAPRASELRPETPPALDRLVHGMVAKDPKERPQDGAELARALGDLARGPACERPSPPPPSLTGSERRVVSVLVIDLSEREETRLQPDATLDQSAPFLPSSARFGVRVHLLGDSTAIAVAPKSASAADQAAVLARFGHCLMEASAGARAALTTGSAIMGGRLPVGEAIDRAMAMARSARPGEGVRADDVTAKLLAARFEIRGEGDRRFILEERSRLDPTRPLLGRPTSCVGRDGELSILEAALTACAEGDGPNVVLVSGGAGAGKSRLAHELVRRLQARSSPPTILQCHGDPLHIGTPYAMVAQLVRRAAGLREREPAQSIRDKLAAHVERLVAGADAARVSEFLGELVGAAFDDEGRLPLRAARHDGAAMADQVARAFEDIMRAWCEKGALTLVLEDLHWTDALSLKLLDRALRKLSGANAFVLALARPEIHDRFSSLFPNRDVIQIRLPPIPKRACARLVHEAMGDHTLPADVERIVAGSEGNGFYLEELIRADAEGPRAGTGATRASTRVTDLPDTVVAVAQARLDRLAPDARRALRAASIYGDAFAIEGVRALVGGAAATLEPILDALIEQEVISPSESPRLAGAREYGFRHTLLRGTAYATLTDDDRTLGHRLAAGWLADVGEDEEIVAMHWLDGGDRVRAAASFTRASDARSARAQPDAAARCAARSLLVADPMMETVAALAARIRLFARALEGSRRIDARDVVSGLERHVRSLDGAPGTAQGVVSTTLEPSLQALRTANEESLPAILSDAACALGAVADRAGARTLLAEAAARAAEDGLVLRAVFQASAKVAYWNNEPTKVVENLGQTVLPEDPRARLESLLILAVAVAWVDGRPALARSLGYVARAEALIRSELGAASALEPAREDPLSLVQCAKARLLCFGFAGEHAKAAECADEAVALTRRAGLRYEMAAHLCNGGEAYLYLGKRDKARARCLESIEIGQDMGDERLVRPNEIFLAHLDGRDGRLAQIADEAGAAGELWTELIARYWLGALLASTPGHETGAREALARALYLARQVKVWNLGVECVKRLEEVGGA